MRSHLVLVSELPTVIELLRSFMEQEELQSWTFENPVDRKIQINTPIELTAEQKRRIEDSVSWHSGNFYSIIYRVLGDKNVRDNEHQSE